MTPSLEAAGPAPAAAVGEMFGRYRVEEYIGGGAMGVVYRASDPKLGRTVAIKLVRPSQRGADAQASLEDEARALARLSHPNIVSVFDVGSVGGQVYLVMELVEGASLAGWLARADRTRQEILEAFDQLASGLAAMHTAGLVHRDVKPANVLVAVDGRVMVSDFGLVHRLHDDAVTGHTSGESSDSSSSARAIGTPAYMAPEQLRGEPVTAASDQFSYCVALFQALCGQPPFPARGVAERYRRIEQRELSSRADILPARLHRVLRRGLAPRAEERFASMDEIRDALASKGRWWRGATLAVVAVVGLGAATLAPTTDPPNCPWLDDARVWDRGSRSRARAAFETVALSHADLAWERVDRAMAEFDATWPGEARTECRARASSAGACLRGQHRRVRMIADLLQTVDQASLDKATNLVESLPSVAACANVQPLTGRAVEAPEVRAAVERARTLWEVARFGQAEVEARKALNGALDAGSPRLASQARFQLGRAKSRQDHFPEAVALLEQAYWSALKHADTTLAAACGLELSYVALEEGDLRSSESWARSVRAELDRLPSPDLLLEAALDQHWGAHYWRLDDFGEAVAKYRLAERHILQAAHPRPLTLASLIQDQAVLLQSQGDCGRALGEFRRALTIVTDSFGPEHPSLAEILNGEGSCLIRLGEVDQARDVLTRALELANASEGQSEGTVARIHTNLADAFSALGELEKADAHFDEALAIFVPTNGPPRTEAFILYLGKASLARLREDYPEARRWALEAGAFCERMFGSEHACSGDVAYDLGGTAMLAEDHQEALRQAVRASTVFAATLGPAHPNVGIALRNVGDAHLALGQPDEAAAVFEKSLKVMLDAGDTERAGPSFSGLAEARLEQGRLTEAEAAARAGLATPLLPIHRGMVALVLAKVLYAQDQRKEAFTVAQKARTDMVELGPHMQVYIDYVDEWLDEVQ